MTFRDCTNPPFFAVILVNKDTAYYNTYLYKIYSILIILCFDRVVSDASKVWLPNNYYGFIQTRITIFNKCAFNWFGYPCQTEHNFTLEPIQAGHFHRRRQTCK